MFGGQVGSEPEEVGGDKRQGGFYAYDTRYCSHDRCIKMKSLRNQFSMRHWLADLQNGLYAVAYTATVINTPDPL